MSFFDISVPSLDNRVYDMQHQPLSEEILTNIYSHTVHRLRSAGFQKEYDIKLISRYSFDFLVSGIEFYKEEHCPSDMVFLLTFSADGMHFITPPYYENTYYLMPWNEYLFRNFVGGEQLSLLSRAPWAQAKFINVGVSNEQT